MDDDAQVRWLDEREQRAWRGLIRMQAQLDAHLRRSLVRDSGLSDADYDVLVHLSEAPEDRLRIFELVRALQWEKSRLSHQLRRMEQRGLLERSECPTDGRGAFVSLTPEGRAAIEAAAPRHVAEVRRHFVDVLTPEQLDVLGDIAEAVLESLQQAEQPTG
ncbi:MAG TPA: MarR family transcriptional regulator [Microthrixaceae bacterium]|nr:MarR family transcriptional regulator [Microthrixaceae bacterium]